MQTVFNHIGNASYITKTITLLPETDGLMLEHTQVTGASIKTTLTAKFGVRDDELAALVASLTEIAVQRGVLPAPSCCYHAGSPAVGCPFCFCNICGDPLDELLDIEIPTPKPSICRDCTEEAARV